MTEEQMKAIFTLAGVEIGRYWRLENGYWPNTEAYFNVRNEQPWWLVTTPVGLVQIGWRKRVILIDWGETGKHCSVTKDDVTKNALMVHAWSYEKAVEYIKKLME